MWAIQYNCCDFCIFSTICKESHHKNKVVPKKEAITVLNCDKTTFEVSSTLRLQHSVLRLCACSSGHTEKAVAFFQAMIELNCFCSPDLEKNTPVAGQIAFLETFWDSGQARYGTFTAERLYISHATTEQAITKGSGHC